MSRVSAASSRSSSARRCPCRPKRRRPAPCTSPRRDRGCSRRAAIVAFLVLQPREEPVELAALEVKLGELADDVELVVEILGPVKRSPVHLDRFFGLILAGERLGQPQHDPAVVGIGPHGPAQSVESFLGSAQPEAELGKELVAFRISRRGRQQVSTGLQCRLDPAQPRFEPGHAGQVLDAIAAVDLGESAQGRRRVAQAARRLAHPGGSVQAGIERGSISTAFSAARTASGSLVSASRYRASTHQAAAVDCRAASSSLRMVSTALRQPAGGLVVLDAGFEDGVFFFVFLGELGGGGELSFGVVILFEAMVERWRA